MTQEIGLENILEAIAGDDRLRDALRARLLPSSNQNTGSGQQHVSIGNPPGAGAHQAGTVDPALATQMYQSGDEPALAAQSHQSGNSTSSANSQHDAGAINPLVSQTHQSGNSDPTLLENYQAQDETINSGEHQLDAHHTEHQLEINHSGHVHPQGVSATLHSFDPESLVTEDDNTFVAQEVITEYIEKHFRRTLNKTSRTAMHRAHPVPRTAVTKPPVVDQFVKGYLKSRFPKQEDGELAKLQSAMLKICGPMTCLWSELIENDLLEDPNATVNVHDVLDIIQRSLVLLGNANELLSQLRRTNILQLVDKSLVKYGQDSPSQAGEFLFGPEFTKHLKDQVESDTSLAQVVSASQRYHPYSNTSRTSTISRSKQQFFRGGPAGNWGSRQGKPHTPAHQNQYRGRGSAKTRHFNRPSALSKKF